MPLITQKIICRSDLRANPTAIYLFGDNHARSGMGGQAREMRGEKNALGIRTKWRPSMDNDAFFSDAQFDEIAQMLFQDFQIARLALAEDLIVVIPQDGLGTGLSQLPTRAPKVYALLKQLIREL